MTANVAIIIPFRDRGTDPLRYLNLRRVCRHWIDITGMDPMISSDGRRGNDQFNRSAAYNRAIQEWPWPADVYVFSEADMLPHPRLVREGIEMALDAPGVVVPFTQYRALNPEDSEDVRAYFKSPIDCTPAYCIDGGNSYGAINIVSRKTIDMIGQWDESFEGNWYDDDAMKVAFEVVTGNKTRFCEGRAWHLYHLPGHKGEHLSDEDRAATLANKKRLEKYRRAARSNNVAEIRRLLKGGA